MIATLVAAAVVGYFVGAVSPATLLARMRGVDLTAVGSGNPGATNVGRALGRRAAVTVALLDVAKGAVPASGFVLLDHEAGLLAGLAAVLGHITSPYLRGHGGKGVATAAGAILGVHPLWLLVVLAVWVAVLAAARWVALASICAGVSVLVVAVASGHDQLWGAALGAVVVARHRRNLRQRWRSHPDPHADPLTS